MGHLPIVILFLLASEASRNRFKHQHQDNQTIGLYLIFTRKHQLDICCYIVILAIMLKTGHKYVTTADLLTIVLYLHCMFKGLNSYLGQKPNRRGGRGGQRHGEQPDGRPLR